MKKLFSMLALGVLVMAIPVRANSLLVTNMGASGTISLVPYTEYQWSLSYNNPQVRITGMQLAFDGNLTQLPQAYFRDNNGNNAGLKTGTLVRNEGSYKVYQFDFGSSFTSIQSQKYAAYGFTAGGPISLASFSGAAAVSFDSAAFNSVNYDYWQPRTATENGSSPLFSILAVPEPSALSLLTLGLGGLAILRRPRTL